MSFKIKLHHFWGTIKHSLIGLIVAIILSIACLLLCLYYSDSNNNVISFLVGVMASVIASIVYDISNKYYKSCSTYMWVLGQTEILITYCNDIQNVFTDDESYRFRLWSTVVTIREISNYLTYTKEFDILSCRFSEIISAAYDNDKEVFLKAVSELINAKEKITTQ